MSPETLAQCMEVHEALEPFGGYTEWWNAPAQIAFSRRVLALGKPLAEVTIGELQAIAIEARNEVRGYFNLRSQA
ncbi:hypothetical protein D9M71_116270 [compost metagenome]